MKIRSAAFLLLLSLLGCNKNDTPSIPNPANKPDISAVPAHFSQNLLIEEFTSSLNGQCPKAHLLRDSLLLSYADRLFDVSIHVLDPMTYLPITNMTNGVNALDSIFNPSGIYPSGMINRQVSSSTDLFPDNWGPNIVTMLGSVPRCGLALEATAFSGSNVTLNVHVGFSDDLAGDYRLHIYVIQKVLQVTDSLYDQMNDFSIEGSTPDSTLSLYTENDTISSYPHRYILKRIVTLNSIAGDVIPASVMAAGGEYVKGYLIDLTGITISASKIIAFVDKYGPTGMTHRIENVQAVNIGEFKDWN